MGWADFGRALYLNYSAAAGNLAETKLALRAEDRAERQLALQEETQKAQVAYQKAQLTLKEFLEEREQARHEEVLQNKIQLGKDQREWEQKKIDDKIAREKGERDRQVSVIEDWKAQNPELEHIADAAIAQIMSDTEGLTQPAISQNLIEQIQADPNMPPEEKRLNIAAIRGVPGAKAELEARAKAAASTGDELYFGLVDETIESPEERERIKQEYVRKKAGMTETDVSELSRALADADKIEDEEIRTQVKQFLVQNFGKGKASDNKTPAGTALEEDMWYAEGRLPPDLVKDIIAFRKDVQSSQNYRDLVKAKRALVVMDKSLEGDSPVSEIGVLYTFIRAIDPGSVVREGEIGIFTAARGVQSRIEELQQKVGEGSALTPQEVQEIAKIAQTMRDAYAEDYEAIKGTVEAGLKAYGAYRRTDKNGEIVPMTDPDTFMQLASFEDVNIEVPADEVKPSGKSLDVQGFVGRLKEEGKTLEEALEVIRKTHPDKVQAFIEAWMGETDNANN